MKAKLLVVLIALFGMYSCSKDTTTTSLELDAEKTIPVSGKLDFFLDYGAALPEGSTIAIVVNNSEYGRPGNSTAGDQVFTAPVGADGTFTYDVPMPTNGSINATIVVADIVVGDHIYVVPSKNISISEADTEKAIPLYYRRSVDGVSMALLSGQLSVIGHYGETIPADTKVKATYNDGQGTNYQFLSLDSEGKFKAELPAGSYILSLPDFQHDNDFVFGMEDNEIYLAGDEIQFENLAYSVKNASVISFKVNTWYGEDLPTNLVVSGVASNGKTYSYTYDPAVDGETSLYKEVYYPNHGVTLEAKDLKVTPASFTTTLGSKFTLIRDDENMTETNVSFTYKRTPSIFIEEDIFINGFGALPSGDKVSVIFSDTSDEDNPITKAVVVTIPLSGDIEMKVPNMFLSSSKVNVDIKYELKEGTSSTTYSVELYPVNIIDRDIFYTSITLYN